MGLHQNSVGLAGWLWLKGAILFRVAPMPPVENLNIQLPPSMQNDESDSADESAA